MAAEYDVRIGTMHRFFEDTEKQFIEISQIIPLNNHPETYSPRFYSILNFACGQIESIMHMTCDHLNLKYEKEDFPNYYKVLNTHGLLECQKIIYREIENPFEPFVIREDYSPDWWKAYNKTKHRLPEGIIEGNIMNTLNALAALCALNHISHTIVNDKESHEQVLMQKNWRIISHPTPSGIMYNIPKSFRDSGMFTSLSTYISDSSASF